MTNLGPTFFGRNFSLLFLVPILRPSKPTWIAHKELYPTHADTDLNMGQEKVATERRGKKGGWI